MFEKVSYFAIHSMSRKIRKHQSHWVNVWGDLLWARNCAQPLENHYENLSVYIYIVYIFNVYIYNIFNYWDVF